MMKNGVKNIQFTQRDIRKTANQFSVTVSGILCQRLELQLVFPPETADKGFVLEFSREILHVICHVGMENHLQLSRPDFSVVAHHIAACPGRLIEKPVTCTICITKT